MGSTAFPATGRRSGAGGQRGRFTTWPLQKSELCTGFETRQITAFVVLPMAMNRASRPFFLQTHLRVRHFVLQLQDIPTAMPVDTRLARAPMVMEGAPTAVGIASASPPLALAGTRRSSLTGNCRPRMPYCDMSWYRFVRGCAITRQITLKLSVADLSTLCILRLTRSSALNTSMLFDRPCFLTINPRDLAPGIWSSRSIGWIWEGSNTGDEK